MAARLGVTTTELPNGTGVAATDRFGTTSVPGVFPAGAGNVAAAIADGRPEPQPALGRDDRSPD